MLSVDVALKRSYKVRTRLLQLCKSRLLELLTKHTRPLTCSELSARGEMASNPSNNNANNNPGGAAGGAVGRKRSKAVAAEEEKMKHATAKVRWLVLSSSARVLSFPIF